MSASYQIYLNNGHVCADVQTRPNIEKPGVPETDFVLIKTRLRDRERMECVCVVCVVRADTQHSNGKWIGMKTMATNSRYEWTQTFQTVIIVNGGMANGEGTHTTTTKQ